MNISRFLQLLRIKRKAFELIIWLFSTTIQLIDAFKKILNYIYLYIYI